MGTTPDVDMEHACRNCLHRKTAWLCTHPKSKHFQQRVGADDTCAYFEESLGEAHFIRAGSTNFLLLNATTVNEKQRWLTEILSNYNSAIQAGLPAEDEAGANLGIAIACGHVLKERFNASNNMAELDSDVAQTMLTSLRRAGETEKKYHVGYVANNWFQLGYVDLLLALKTTVIHKKESAQAAERFVRDLLAIFEHVIPTPLPRLQFTLGNYLLQAGKREAAANCLRDVCASISRKESRFIPNVASFQREADSLLRQASGVTGTQQNDRTSTSRQTVKGRSSNQPTKSGCFIATAAFGSPYVPEVEFLRSFRDTVLLKSWPGRAFVRFYYRVSPPLADVIVHSSLLRTFARHLLIAPILYVLKLLIGDLPKAKHNKRQTCSMGQSTTPKGALDEINY